MLNLPDPGNPSRTIRPTFGSEGVSRNIPEGYRGRKSGLMMSKTALAPWET